MEISEFFLKLLVILVSAKLFAEIFAYFRIPSVLGEVIAGIIIGPSVFGFILPNETFYILSEIGILLLLFEVGLETDVSQLVKVGLQSSLVAITGVVLPAVAGFWISNNVFELPFTVSLFVGGTLVATSIGITVRVLTDINKQRSRTARIVLGAAVIDDIIGVVILTILYDFAIKGKINILSTIKIIGFITVFMLATPIIIKSFLPIISRLSDTGGTKGMLPTVIVSIILALAVISHKIGAPEILGSFAAGIALAKRFCLPFMKTWSCNDNVISEKIEIDMKPIIDLFVPVFFVVVGASINLKEIDFTSITFWQLAGLLTVVAIIAKVLSGIWVKGSLREKISVGTAMVPRGEVGLIFAEVGKKNGIFDDTVYTVVVFVVALTTLFGPLLLRIVMKGET
jgi:Kef-type K+ transport system membrane component KefB